MILSVKDEKKLLDALVKNQKISPDEAEKWRDLSNADLEKELITKGFTPDDIGKAYASLFSLPFVNLKDTQIAKESLEAIPENLAREYQIIAYEYNFPHKVLKVAVSEPGKLTPNLESVLKDLEQKKQLKFEFAITTPADFEQVIGQYANLNKALPPQNPPPTANIPANKVDTINLDTIEIPYEVISKFPEDIARKYQMVVFESPHSSFIKIALTDPNDRKVREILDFVKEKNDIVIQEYQTSPGQIHKAFRFYEKPKESEAKTKLPENDLSPKQFAPTSPPPPPPSPPLDPAPSTSFGTSRGKPEPKPQEPKPEIDQNVPEVKSKEPEKPILGSEESDLDKFLSQEIKEVGDIQAIAEEGNVPQIVAAAIALATRRKASDIHIEPSEGYLRVRFRIDGILRDIIKLPLSMLPAIISRIKILSKLKLDESRVPQDGRLDAVTGGHQIDVRVSTLPTVNGEKVAMRILDKSLKMYTLEELGLTGRGLKLVTENIDKPFGVILSTGPTGSGKSTTLYAILNRISTASVNIVTLEDPVEYEIVGINQCQIKPRIGFTFANGLRSVLRQDPNIIMVGEIRDAETASLATHAALTGHLVLSSLHTNDATGALPRLINMGVEPFLITSSINCIIGQRLVRKLCPKCKRPAHIPEPVQKEIEEELSRFDLPKPYQFFEGKGCDECDQGYKGRIGIFEVLSMSEKIENLAIARRPASEIKTTAIEEGMITMKQDGLIKALKGITTVNEVLRVVTI